jgi:hypothetical protein
MYFIYDNAVQKGPFGLGELEKMLEEGAVSPTAFYWTEKMAEWKPLGEFSLFPTPPPPPVAPSSPLPALSEKAVAIEHVRIYTIARYQRSFWLALGVWTLAFVLIFPFALVSHSIPAEGGALGWGAICIGLTMTATGILVMWAWFRTRWALYGPLLAVLVALLCLGMPGLILAELLFGAFKIRAIYKQEDINTNSLGFCDKETIEWLKPDWLSRTKGAATPEAR